MAKPPQANAFAGDLLKLGHFSSKQEVKELIARTDHSLFRAKALGKNQLVTEEKIE
ncbi:hypothetical protein [Microcystis aeruginosa]|uniref:Uncharacterized protein n=1 Tax=Microcystis aeruginosa NIES-2521 TaxID=2303983 RepID=A0A5A5S369_MICAE|nr:hypothetical protein [Microcystis aeruginosa]GCA79787.1 hypothetical protein MiTs_01784 [Microcystis aeruginosa NIES-2521]